MPSSITSLVARRLISLVEVVSQVTMTELLVSSLMGSLITWRCIHILLGGSLGVFVAVSDILGLCVFFNTLNIFDLNLLFYSASYTIRLPLPLH